MRGAQLQHVADVEIRRGQLADCCQADTYMLVWRRETREGCCMETRKTLIERLQAQQCEHAWEDFADTYSRYIYVVIRNMNVDHHDAEDLVQQVLLRTWRGLPNFDYQPAQHRFRSWLCTVTRNCVRTFMSKRARRKEDLTDEPPVAQGEGAITLPDVEQIAEREWQTYIGNLAMAAVKKRFQPHIIEAFEMFRAGKSSNEVSEQLGLPVNTTHVYKKRVQNALTKEIMRLDYDLG